MPLPQSVNERFSRIASVAQGARSDGWQKVLPIAVSALLVLLLAWQLVQLGWAVLAAKSGTSPTPPAGVPSVSAPPPRAVDIGSIVNAHLFGEASAPAGAADPNSVAASQMPLFLVGTIANTDPTLGYAIIGDSPATAKVYSVGKTITGGTKLHSVYPDRAILDRGGKLEALLLPKKFQGGGMSASVPPGANPADPMLGDRLRQLAATNPSAITDVMRPQPVFANGQQRGYRVYPGRSRAVFNRLGLLPGDLVTAVNGTPLDDPSRGMDVLQTLNSAPTATVTIERNGTTVQVNINNAQVAQDAAAAEAGAVSVTEMQGSAE